MTIWNGLMTLKPYADLPLVDEPYLSELRAALGDDRFKTLFDSFDVEATACVAELKKAIRESNDATTRFSAHKLKGIAQNLGLPRLGRIAREIETAASQAATPPASIDALDQILEQTASKIRAFA